MRSDSIGATSSRLLAPVHHIRLELDKCLRNWLGVDAMTCYSAILAIYLAIGLVAEWLRSGLQIRVLRFDSGRGLQHLLPDWA